MQHDAESVPLQITGAQLVHVAPLAQHPVFRVLELGQVGRMTLGKLDAEPLTVMSSQSFRPSLPASLSGTPLALASCSATMAVLAPTFLDLHPRVFNLTGRRPQGQFDHGEILVEVLQRGAGAAGRVRGGPADSCGAVAAIGVGDVDPRKAALERGRSPTRRGVGLAGRHLSARLCQGCNPQGRLTSSRIQSLCSNLSAVNWSARSASPGSSLYCA